MNISSVCLVIPAYNEAKALGGVLDGVAQLGLDVLVVDDGSSDDTAAIAADAGVHLVRHETNRGKGVAIRTAIDWVLAREYGAALFLDADGQHLPGEVPLFLAEYHRTGADLIVGSRMADTRSMPVHRRFANRFSSTLVSCLAGTRVTDSQSGYRLLSVRLLEQLRNRGGAGFDFETEMIIDAVRGGLGYAEVPISCVYGDERSHYNPWRDSTQFFALLGRKLFEKRPTNANGT